MRVTEQIDALSSMGANPIHYLVVPRFLGCLVLIPTLTIMADFMGVVGGAVYSIYQLGIDSHHYWENSQQFIGVYDLFSGVFKSLFFGATIALISCHRGFNCDPGAEGVGRAATSAFVYSFVIILVLDLELGILLDAIYVMIWPEGKSPVLEYCQEHRENAGKLYDSIVIKIRNSPSQIRNLSSMSTAAEKKPPQPLLETRHLHVKFGKQHVLRDVSLSVMPGQTLAVIGESGCGKTVLLKTLIGLVRPTQGQVMFDGRDVSTLTEKELTHERIRFGFVFQQAALFDSMTIEQNVSFPLRQHTQKPKSEIREIVHARLAEVGLPESVLFKKPAELSGGMRKRVGLARALALSPQVILYDEPTTGLDPIMSDVINELILRAGQSHPVTSIVVTHDMHTANKVADRVVMLYPYSRLRKDESQVLFDGPPEDLEDCGDTRVTQFIHGEAGERLMEMRERAANVSHFDSKK